MTEASREWELRASCRAEDPEIWFDGHRVAEAIAFCRGCPVREECLAAALEREKGVPKPHRVGIVAGLTGAERYALARSGAQAPAPRKKTGGRRPQGPPPCGTRPAYQRHVRLGEPIDDACREANAMRVRQYRRTGSMSAAASQ